MVPAKRSSVSVLSAGMLYLELWLIPYLFHCDWAQPSVVQWFFKNSLHWPFSHFSVSFVFQESRSLALGAHVGGAWWCPGITIAFQRSVPLERKWLFWRVDFGAPYPCCIPCPPQNPYRPHPQTSRSFIIQGLAIHYLYTFSVSVLIWIKHVSLFMHFSCLVF